MSEEYLAQESEEEGIEEDSSEDLTEEAVLEEYEDDWDQIEEDAIEDGVDIEDEEAFTDWLAENYEELDEDDEEDDEEDEDEDPVGDEDEVEEGAAERKKARLAYKKASKKMTAGDRKKKAKRAAILKKKRGSRKAKKRGALKADFDVENDVEEGAKERKAARLAYKKSAKKMTAGDKKKRAKMAAIAKKKRGSRKAKKRGALKASMIPGTKNQMLKNIYDVVNGMLKSDLASKYEQIMGATDLEEIEEEVTEPIRTKVAVRAEDITPVDVEDDVQALMANEEGLSNEFKEKASTIFEAAVHAKVVDELNTKLEEIEGEKAKEDETFQKELTEKVDGYLTYVVEEWMKENELAIDRGIRSELVEDFMSGLRTLFTEHYIDIPEEKVDMVDDLFTKVEDLETSLDEEINRGVELQKELAQFKKDDALKSATKDLADTDSEKISKLAEGIEFENTEQYIEKLNVLKESYFPKSDAVTSEITETDETIEVSDEKQEIRLDESMKHYTSAIKRYNS